MSFKFVIRFVFYLYVSDSKDSDVCTKQMPLKVKFPTERQEVNTNINYLADSWINGSVALHPCKNSASCREVWASFTAPLLRLCVPVAATFTSHVTASPVLLW